jgi:ABC-type branched-subunit amino acid transport system ATPase component
MLTRAHIKNVLSCGEIDLQDLSQVTALVGRNGAGKSNVLRAIEWAARTAVSSKPIEIVDAMIEYDHAPSAITLEFAAAEFTYRYTLEVDHPKIEVDGGKPIFGAIGLRESLEWKDADAWSLIFARTGETIRLTGRPDLQIGGLTPGLPAIESLLPQEDGVLRTIQPAIRFLRRIDYYPLDEPAVVSGATWLVQHSEYAKWLAEQARSPDPSSSVVMRLIDMSQRKPDRFDELKQLVGENGLSILGDIRVELYPGIGEQEGSPKEQRSLFYYVTFLPMGHKTQQKYGALSFGTRRQLQILVSLIFNNSTVMLLEQPEDGIHPGLLYKLIPLLKSYSDLTQVILASHSPTVLNCLIPREIRVVEMKDGETALRALSAEELAGAERYISLDGPLSDFIETVQDEG